jgi:D-alanyl-lipoteichoic acid acyltransferase DltB (MBOAT superfamily)
MLFNSIPFTAGFLPLFLLGFFLLGRLSRQGALPFLLLASLGFYAWWRPSMLPLLLVSIAGNFAIGRQIQIRAPPSAKRWLTVGTGANLALLFWFKYAGLFALTLGLADPGITLPLAISFFTFQQIMFLTECYRHPGARYGFVPYASFVAFFAHLIAGPIVRPAEIVPQFTHPRFGIVDHAALASGLTLFLLGLGKKLVLADTFAAFADPGFHAAATGAPLTLVEAWCALLAYALQIYFDFSGYSDMAIGLAGMIGIRFPLNFDAPYRAASIADFWHRWHITLGRFLRDYLYIPLGGNRHGKLRASANIMATMLLGGLWHGANWNFALWGGLHGAYLLIHRAWRGHAPFHLPRPLAHAVTLFAVVLAWVPFRADSWAATLAMARGLAGANGFALPEPVIAALPALAHLATPVPVLLYLGDARTLALPEAIACLGLGWAIVLLLPPIHRLTATARAWALTASFALTVQALVFAPRVTPFLYFRF